MNFPKWVTFLFWASLTVFYSLLIASGSWIAVAVIPAAFLLLILALKHYKLFTIIWLTGTPTLFVFANNFLTAIPLLRVERALVPILLAYTIAAPIFLKKKLRPLLPIEKTMFVMVVICSLSLLSVNYDKSIIEAKDSLVFFIHGFLLPYLAFFVARQINWTPRDISILIWILIGAGVYLAIAGLLQYFFNIGYFYPRYFDAAIEDRSTGSFRTPGEYGLVMATLLFIVLYKFVNTQDSVIRFILLAISALFIAGLFVSLTRASWLSAVAGIAIITLMDKRVRGVISVGAIACAIAFVAALPFFAQQDLLSGRIFDITTMYPRITAYTSAANMIMHNPVLGLGFDRFTFFEAKAEYATSFGLVSPQWTVFAGVPHNDFVHILVLTGIVGLIPFLLIVLWTFRLTQQDTLAASGANSWRIEFSVYVRAIIVAYLASALFVDVLFYGYFIMLMFFLLGVITSYDDSKLIRLRSVDTHKRH